MHVKRMAAALLVLMVVVCAAYGVPLRSKGIPNGWIEDFTEAKAVAAKENKHILMCSVASDTKYGKKMYDEVYSRGKFSSKLKKRFVLMMVDTSTDSENLSRVALAQNSDLRNHYGMRGNGNSCVVDKDGNCLRRFSVEGDASLCQKSVESATNDILPPSPVKQVAAGDKPGNQHGVIQRPSANRPTPASFRSMTPNAHLQEGNRLAAAGEWDEALRHFRHSGGRVAKIAEYEMERKAPLIKLADAWWTEIPLVPDVKTRLAYHSHSAHLYRTALAEGGLSKELAEMAAHRGAGKGKARYCVIDLSGGANAVSYPALYLDDVPEGGWSDVYKTSKLVLRRIEPGTFIMGKNQNNDSHSVTITKPFYIGIFEVTQKQWELVMGTQGSSDRQWYKGDLRPANYISYDTICGATKEDAANSFIGRIRARSGFDFCLPTEAQWEYACRAGTKSCFNNGGDKEEDMFNVGRFFNNQSAMRKFNKDESEIAFAKAQQRPDGKGGYLQGAAAVGSYLPNKWGLYDMHGNVSEICRDLNGCRCFGEDPVGSTIEDICTIRGGHWSSGAKFSEGDGEQRLDSLKSHAWAKFRHDGVCGEVGFRVSYMPGGVVLSAQSVQRQTSERTAAMPQKAPVVSTPTVPDVAKGQYCVIDLSRGANAYSYPVSYLDSMPENGWSDDFKTSKMVLRRIPAGSFVMGADQGDASCVTAIEKPYYIGVFEVTQRQWELVTGGNPAVMKGAMRPVENVSLNTVCGGTAIGSASFLGRLRSRTRLGFDLPTEAQWEFACRAGTTSDFNNGCDNEYEEMWQLGRFYLNQGKSLEMLMPADPNCRQRPDGRGGYREGHAEVGSYMPNNWRLYDMHGNVAEMCRGGNGSCVVRGGAWSDSTYRQGRCRLVSSARADRPSDTHNDSLGVRLVFTVR